MCDQTSRGSSRLVLTLSATLREVCAASARLPASTGESTSELVYLGSLFPERDRRVPQVQYNHCIRGGDVGLVESGATRCLPSLTRAQHGWVRGARSRCFAQLSWQLPQEAPRLTGAGQGRGITQVCSSAALLPSTSVASEFRSCAWLRYPCARGPISQR